eukprot:TRINITY_DN16099_c0_g1_i1.p1 TRINITY_DN16099_c0_g1~~TRINITY_DN16099_c0_g1_i1.p1  ORF type:complete len:748 (-),score=122.95 TRINITY_DN16099_c0_g1_i1:54-2297(-)
MKSLVGEKGGTSPSAAPSIVNPKGTRRFAVPSLFTGLKSKKAGQAWRKNATDSGYRKDRNREDVQRRLVGPHGHVIIEAPEHAARLTPIRGMSLDFESTADKENANTNRTPKDAANDPPSDRPRVLSKSFSSKCFHVLNDQRTTASLNALRLFLDCEFFKPCCPAFLRGLIAAGGKLSWQGEDFHSESTVYAEGSTGITMYIIVRGVAVVVTKERPQETRELRAGDSFGEAQVLGVVSQRHETVSAKTPLHVLVVSGDVLSRLLKQIKVDEEDMFDAARVASTQAVNSDGSRAKAWIESNQVEASQDEGRLAVDDDNSCKKKKASTARRNGYVFLEERRHFERESVRLYLEVGLAHRQELAKNRTSGRTRRGKLANTDVADEAEVMNDIGHDARHHRIGDSNTPEVPSRRLATDAPSRASPATPASPASARGAAPSARSEMRGRYQQTNEVPNEDGCGAQERFMQRLEQSIRTDMRRGLMMPADCLGVSGNPSRGGGRFASGGCTAASPIAPNTAAVGNVAAVVAPRGNTPRLPGGSPRPNSQAKPKHRNDDVSRTTTASSSSPFPAGAPVESQPTVVGHLGSEVSSKVAPDMSMANWAFPSAGLRTCVGSIVTSADDEEYEVLKNDVPPINLDLLPPLDLLCAAQKSYLMKHFQEQARQAKAKKNLISKARRSHPETDAATKSKLPCSRLILETLNKVKFEDDDEVGGRPWMCQQESNRFENTNEPKDDEADEYDDQDNVLIDEAL